MDVWYQRGALTFLSPIHLISLQKVFQLPIRNYSKRNLASLMIHTTCSFFKGFSLLCEGGCITYITPKTFWTTQTKRNLRDLLLANTLNYVFDTANPFEAVMVDTCITSAVKNKPAAENLVRFMDGRKSLLQPERLTVAQSVYLNTQNSVIFKPSELNMRIYEPFMAKKVKSSV